jgi:hypothetical protein
VILDLDENQKFVQLRLSLELIPFLHPPPTVRVDKVRYSQTDISPRVTIEWQDPLPPSHYPGPSPSSSSPDDNKRTAWYLGPETFAGLNRQGTLKYIEIDHINEYLRR